MNWLSLKARIKLVDDRTKALFKKYPFVGAAVFLVGVIVGTVIGMVL